MQTYLSVVAVRNAHRLLSLNHLENIGWVGLPETRDFLSYALQQCSLDLPNYLLVTEPGNARSGKQRETMTFAPTFCLLQENHPESIATSHSL